MTTDSATQAVSTQAVQNNASVPIKNTSRTLAFIKPDAIQAGHKDEILNKIVENGFKIIQEREIHLSKKKARAFYKEHAGKIFYKKLIDWMNSVPIYAVVLEKDNAIQDWRDLMGPADPKKARETKPQSIRALYGTDGSQNAVHGSASEDSVNREIEIIFGSLDLPPEESSINIEQQVQATKVQSINPADEDSLASNTQIDDGNRPSTTASDEEELSEKTATGAVPETVNDAQTGFGALDEKEGKEVSAEEGAAEIIKDNEKKNNCADASPELIADYQPVQNEETLCSRAEKGISPELPTENSKVGAAEQSTGNEEAAPEEPAPSAENSKHIETEQQHEQAPAKNTEAEDSISTNESKDPAIDSHEVLAEILQTATPIEGIIDPEQEATNSAHAHENGETEHLIAEQDNASKNVDSEQSVADTQAMEIQQDHDTTEDVASAAIIDTIVDQYTGSHDEQTSPLDGWNSSEVKSNADTASSDVNRGDAEQTENSQFADIEEATSNDIKPKKTQLKAHKDDDSAAENATKDLPVSLTAPTTDCEAVGRPDSDESSVQQDNELLKTASNTSTTSIGSDSEQKNQPEIPTQLADSMKEADTLQDGNADEEADTAASKLNEAAEEEEANTDLAHVPVKLTSGSVANDEGQISEAHVIAQSEDNINLSEQNNDTIPLMAKQQGEPGVTNEHTTLDAEKTALPASQGDTSSSTDQESKPRLNKVPSSSVIDDRNIQLKPKVIGTTAADKEKITGAATSVSPSGSSGSNSKKAAAGPVKARTATVSNARANSNSRIAAPSKTRKPAVAENKEKTTAASTTSKRQTVPSRLISPSKRATTAATADTAAAKEISTKKATAATSKRASLVSRLTAPTAASARKKSAHVSAGSADRIEDVSKDARLRRPAPTAIASIGSSSGFSAKTGSQSGKTSPSTTSTLKGTSATANKLRVTGTARATVSKKSANQEGQNDAARKNNEIKNKNSVRPSSGTRTSSNKTGSSIPATATATTKRVSGIASGVGSRVNQVANAANTRKEILSKRSSKLKSPKATSLAATNQVKQSLNKVKKDHEEQARESPAGDTSPLASSRSGTYSLSSIADVKSTGDDTAEPVDENDTDKSNDIRDSDNEISDLTNNDEELPIEAKDNAHTTYIGNTTVEEGKQYSGNHDSGSCTPVDALVTVTVATDDALQLSLSQTATVIDDTATKVDNATTAQPLTKKLQMASLRDKFENLSHASTNGQQQHATAASKDVLSRSPNRISDMVNRFTKN